MALRGTLTFPPQLNVLGLDHPLGAVLCTKLMWEEHTYGGSGGKRVKDKDVRNCKVLRVGKAWDAALYQSDWAKICKKFAPDTRFVPQDVLLYNAGGKFAEHTDRKRPRNGYHHIGTLVVVAPTGFSGGDLRLEGKILIRGGVEAHAWGFLPLGAPHEVTEVTKGSRVALTFGVYEPVAAPPAKPPTPSPRVQRSPGDRLVRINGKTCFRKPDGTIRRIHRRD